MKTVTQTDVAGSRFGDFETIRLIAEAGFDGVDYSMFEMHSNDHILNSDGYLAYVDKLLETAEKYGVTFEQAHAPFPSAKDGNDEYNADIMMKLKRSIEIAGRLNAGIIVVHPVYYKENKFEKNMALYNELGETAAKFGVKIALENMWGRKTNDYVSHIIPNVCSVAEEFNEYVDALDSGIFTACLDIGHCGLVGDNAASMIRSMGSRIGCLHVHDNDNVNDSHTLPYMMSLDFDGILKALAEVKYSGNFTFEADNFIRKFPGGLTGAALRLMNETGRYMVEQLESYKNILA